MYESKHQTLLPRSVSSQRIRVCGSRTHLLHQIVATRLCWPQLKATITSAHSMTHEQACSKVPAVTVGFWVIKIFATTLGETGGDAVSMSMDLGYLLSTAI